MAFIQRLFLSCTLLGVALVGLPISSTTHTVQPFYSKSEQIRASTAPGQVTIILLDMSQSMNDNDTLGIRCSAAEAYIDLSQDGDQIGIIGLSNTDGTLDQHGFLTANIWQTPLLVDMQRQSLKKTINQRPPDTPSCQHPTGSTPLYDALAKAFAMLQKATSGNTLQGSVIMMSDGQPYPQENAQMEQVRNNLLPLFFKHKWPIETISLGGQTGYLTFLQDIAQKTGGSFYNDTQGSTPGDVSPLNITNFFIQILAKRQNRTVNTHASVQMLAGAAWHKSIMPPEHTRHLDIVVANDQGIQVTLTTPEGTVFPTAPPEEDIHYTGDNPYYEIFSINNPRPSPYQLNISGQGQFLFYDLAISYLQISITSPAPPVAVQQLKHSFTLKAQVVDSEYQDELIKGSHFALTGSLQYQGEPEKGTHAVRLHMALSDTASPGTYQAIFPLPPDASPGLYSITVEVSGDTTSSIAHASRNVWLVHLPTLHVSPLQGQHATSITEVQQTQWPALFSVLYNPDDPLTYWPAQLALQHHPLNPSVILKASIQVDANSFSHLTITDIVIQASAKPLQHLKVIDDHGQFIFTLPRLPDGTYTLTFTLNGTFEDDSFHLDTPYSNLHLISIPPPEDWLKHAFIFTAIYILLFLFGIYLYWYISGPSPFGKAQLLKDDGQVRYNYPFKPTWRNLLWRHTLYSEKIHLPDQRNHVFYWHYLPKGLVIRFHRYHTIKIRRRLFCQEAKNWRYKGGSQEKLFPLLHTQKVDRLIYLYTDERGTTISRSEYTIEKI